MRPHDVLSILALAYWTVLVVELVGDRALYAIASLASRYRPVVVFAGISAAFMAKVLAAVWFGRFLLALPPRATAVVSALTLFTTAILLWRRRGEPRAAEAPRTADTPRASDAPRPANALRILATSGLGTSFLTLFLSEWGDLGQMSVAAIASRTTQPFAVWLGATAALMTKGLIALTVGVQLRRHLPASASRLVATASCVLLGAFALRGAFAR